MKIEITDDDISYAETLLLPTGRKFNEERRAFIRCMESRDAVACPGSGKTTALLAKLLILAGKMPFADGRGICVLAHTNVAIDEIKQKASVASASLFRYPNFFGTIQSFVNQFLCGPWYRSEYRRSIVAIENDRFFRELDKLYSRDYALQRWLEPRGGLSTLGRYWFNPGTLHVGESLDTPIARLSEHTNTFRKIQAVRRNVLEQGILSYDDAYAIALKYLLTMANVAQAISSRFCMVFLDETQDTDEHQFRIMDAIFRPGQVIIQRIGDPNQAIYHDLVHSEGCWTPRTPLSFSDSRRYGETIKHLLITVRLEDSIAMQPCESTASLQPYMMTYQDGEEQTVIRAFSSLIEELSDALPSNGTYKAIGWIGRDRTADDRLCIPTYFPCFDRSHKAQDRHFSNLISYSARAIQIAGTEGAKRFLEIVLQGITRALDIASIREEVSQRRLTPNSVDYHWKREHEKSYFQFRQQMAECLFLALNSGITPSALRDKIRCAVESVWPVHDKAAAFLNNNSVESATEFGDDTTEVKNRFVADNGIVIHVETVHSVKGETHTGTLYLETQYEKDCDASRLIEFLKGNRPKSQLRKPHHQQNLKVAHVAFSRPTHLLAFACRASSIVGHEDDLKKNGWVIRTISELTANEGVQETFPEATVIL